MHLVLTVFQVHWHHFSFILAFLSLVERLSPGRYLIHVWWNNREMNPFIYYFLLRALSSRKWGFLEMFVRNRILSLIRRTRPVYSGGTILQRLEAAQRRKPQSNTKVWIPLRSPQSPFREGWLDRTINRCIGHWSPSRFPHGPSWYLPQCKN